MIRPTLASLKGKLAPALQTATRWCQDESPTSSDAPARHSSLEFDALQAIQVGTLRYSYRGIHCAKNPFDLAIYQLLLARLRPATIIEVGSASGGSAIWFADVTRNLGLDCRIVSVDLKPPHGVADPAVRFLQGDILALDETELSSLLKDAPHPFLISEDGPHTYEGCRAGLEFFHPYLRTGDYYVVEDGIVQDLRLEEFEDGPHRAINEHLRKHALEYTIDRELCDLFGRNVTWNPDGYLRRI